MANRQYEVEVKSPRHGRYGCTTYFGLVLSCGSMKDAKDFAWEIVSEMTKGEFNDRCIGEGPWIYPSEFNQKIGTFASVYSYSAKRFVG